MSKSAVITARLEESLAADLDRLAERIDRSRAWVIAAAVERYVREESEFLAFVQEGIDDLENGRWIAHDDLMRHIRERRAGKRAA